MPLVHGRSVGGRSFDPARSRGQRQGRRHVPGQPSVTPTTAGPTGVPQERRPRRLPGRPPPGSAGSAVRARQSPASLTPRRCTRARRTRALVILISAAVNCRWQWVSDSASLSDGTILSAAGRGRADADTPGGGSVRLIPPSPDWWEGQLSGAAAPASDGSLMGAERHRGRAAETRRAVRHDSAGHDSGRDGGQRLR